jgi:WD40-like Beta Propeller Repeat
MKKLIIFVLLAAGFVSQAQTATEIILLDIKSEYNQFLFSNPVNITKHKGYDNQPSFHPSKPVIYFSSFNDDGRSDIKMYNYETGKTSNITETNEREYSPVVTPDGKYISCIIQRDNGAQDLGKYPINGGKPEVLIDNLKVGYHGWVSKDKLLLFVLGDSSTNTSSTLHLYDLSSREDKILASNIGRSLHNIPGENAMSFVQKISKTESHIMKFDIKTGTISKIASTIPGKEDLAWLQNNILLMGQGDGIYLYDTKQNEGWLPNIVEGDASLMRGITRLAVNAGKSKLAIVVNE